jgi:hypothetical protein
MNALFSDRVTASGAGAGRSLTFGATAGERDSAEDLPATPLPDALVVGAGEGEVSVLVGAGEVAVEACGVGAESVALAAATPKGAMTNAVARTPVATFVTRRHSRDLIVDSLRPECTPETGNSQAKHIRQ